MHDAPLLLPPNSETREQYAPSHWPVSVERRQGAVCVWCVCVCVKREYKEYKDSVNKLTLDLFQHIENSGFSVRVCCLKFGVQGTEHTSTQVQRTPGTTKYCVSYFKMNIMRSCPPFIFQENIS